MSSSKSAGATYVPNQYVGQRAEGYSTQIVGNVGTLYSSHSDDTTLDCCHTLWKTNPQLTDPVEDRKSLIDRKGSRVTGTCEWIRNHQSYKGWLECPPSLLWLSGGPGKGKTMLSIFLAEELEQLAKQSHERAIFLQYFCDNTDEKRNTATNVVRSLTLQLLSKHPDRHRLIEHILPTFRLQKDLLFTESSFGSLWTCFEAMVRDTSLGTVYCVIDGLDECSETSLGILLKRLRELFSINSVEDVASTRGLRLIVVSRERPDCIARELSAFSRVRLDPDAESDISSDIDKFIAVKVNELAVTQSYPLKLRSFVEDAFHQRAEGTFLWIGIVAKELEGVTRGSVKAKLERFPSGLDGLYGRLLLQIPPEDRSIITAILRWVVSAIRPLTILELGTAVGISPDEDLGLSCEDLTHDQIKSCGHLLIVSQSAAGEQVGLVHQSVKDYLLHGIPRNHSELVPFQVNDKVAHGEIAKRCLDYLKNGPLTDGIIDSQPDHYLQTYTKSPDRYPLVPYAASYLTEHLQGNEAGVPIGGEIQNFLQRYCLGWLEVIGQLGIVSQILLTVTKLQDMVDVSVKKCYA